MDDADYTITADPEKSDLLSVSMYLPCYAQISSRGTEACLKRIYGDLLVAPLDRQSVSLSIECSKVKNAGEYINPMDI
jgi:hypothetical protein